MKKGVFGVRAFVIGLIATVLVGGGAAGSALACGGPQSTTYSGSTLLAPTMPQVRHGNSGVNVLSLQLALRNQGYKRLQGSGYYGDNTLAAVRAFQARKGIRTSGIVGSKTWHALLGRRTVGPAAPTYGIQPGECNWNKTLRLNDAMQRVYPYPLLSGSKCYVKHDQQLVKDFQRRAGINPSGIVGPKTWSGLYKVIAASSGWGC